MYARSVIGIGLCLLGGCVSGRAATDRADYRPTTSQRLTIDNSTIGPVRVYLALDYGVILLGRLESMERRQLRMPAGINATHSRARIVVVPLGAPDRFSQPTNSPLAVWSEPLHALDILEHSWRYSGSLIVMLLR